ncbi:TonB-dependent receptor plug domain-containing protein [Roseateles aquatilis]|uniref:TonB-dependent receptor plug domain-containing protein n=1 Tax=Roseateles aquatilis TaxID=431061 RepID=UPI00112FF808|nr:TonB-dependent receptor [Roseateles aquatilis]MBY0364658.1 TonB-dependent receptor [Burkholderiaceae bacterium]
MLLRHAAPLIGLALASATGAVAQPSDLPADADPYPVVLTPTRLRQSLQDVPAAVTIITADMLKRFGIRTIPEALRLVPGMEITRASGPDYRINYHGGSVLVPRRMNVLIDGVSAYQPLFARVDWSSLPIAIDDVERIEITRGSNSAAYGPNSMLAIVNIISRHPRDVGRAFAAIEKGSNGVAAATVRLGAAIGDADLRLTISREVDGGYDSQQRAGADHDSQRLTRANLRVALPLGPASTADINIGHVEGVREVPGVDSGGVTYPDALPQDTYASLTLTHNVAATHQLQVRAYSWVDRIQQSWSTCYPTAFFLPELFNLYRANPRYANEVLAGRAPTGGSVQDDALAATAIAALRALGTAARTPTCGTADQSLVQRRWDVEIQDTQVLSEQFRFVVGAGVRQHSGSSATYLGTAARNTIWRAFGNLEYRPIPDLALNLGGYGERDELSGSTFSPRLAANYRLTDQQTVRFAWTRGNRTPDVQEQRADWSYTLYDANPALRGSSTIRLYQSAQSPGGLTAERIRSVEFGYLLNVPSYGLLLDAKAFDDRLTNLISEKLQLSSFAPTNSGAVRLTGVEVQASAALASNWSVFANYAYLQNHDATNALETTQYSRHSGSVGVWTSFGAGWSISAAYFGASGNGLGQTAYGRTDITLGKSLRTVGQQHVEASLTARRLDNPEQTYFRDFGANGTLKATYSSRLQLLGQIRVNF